MVRLAPPRHVPQRMFGSQQLTPSCLLFYTSLYTPINYYDSVIPKVMPHCLVNGVLTFLIFYAKSHGMDFTSNPSGHKYLAVVRACRFVCL
jgi:hypothetical protein